MRKLRVSLTPLHNNLCELQNVVCNPIAEPVQCNQNALNIKVLLYVRYTIRHHAPARVEGRGGPRLEHVQGMT